MSTSLEATECVCEGRIAVESTYHGCITALVDDATFGAVETTLEAEAEVIPLDGIKSALTYDFTEMIEESKLGEHTSVDDDTESNLDSEFTVSDAINIVDCLT